MTTFPLSSGKYPHSAQQHNPIQREPPIVMYNKCNDTLLHYGHQPNGVGSSALACPAVGRLDSIQVERLSSVCSIVHIDSAAGRASIRNGPPTDRNTSSAKPSARSRTMISRYLAARLGRRIEAMHGGCGGHATIGA